MPQSRNEQENRLMHSGIQKLLARATKLPNGCVALWPVNSQHYPMVSFEGIQWSAHRLVWTLTNGAIPSGMSVLHRCDNRRCINAEHLFLGTQQDNVDDMMEKGRFVKKGEGKTTSGRINLYLAEDIVAIGRELAAKDNRSLSNYISKLILDAKSSRVDALEGVE